MKSKFKIFVITIFLLTTKQTYSLDLVKNGWNYVSSIEYKKRAKEGMAYLNPKLILTSAIAGSSYGLKTLFAAIHKSSHDCSRNAFLTRTYVGSESLLNNIKNACGNITSISSQSQTISEGAFYTFMIGSIAYTIYLLHNRYIVIDRARYECLSQGKKDDSSSDEVDDMESGRLRSSNASRSGSAVVSMASS